MSNAAITQADAGMIAKEECLHLIADSLEIAVHEELPASCSVYGLPTPAEPCWWVLVNQNTSPTMLDGTALLVCVSKDTGKILWRGRVQSGG